MGNNVLVRAGQGGGFNWRLYHNGLCIYKVAAVAGGQQYVHRQVLSKKLGRALWPWEQVHHKNGNTLDNRPDNLVCLSRASHAQAHRHRLCKESA